MGFIIGDLRNCVICDSRGRTQKSSRKSVCNKSTAVVVCITVGGNMKRTISSLLVCLSFASGSGICGNLTYSTSGATGTGTIFLPLLNFPEEKERAKEECNRIKNENSISQDLILSAIEPVNVEDCAILENKFYSSESACKAQLAIAEKEAKSLSEKTFDIAKSKLQDACSEVPGVLDSMGEDPTERMYYGTNLGNLFYTSVEDGITVTSRCKKYRDTLTWQMVIDIKYSPSSSGATRSPETYPIYLIQGVKTQELDCIPQKLQGPLN